jgi:DnaK suppressor protein
MLTVAMPNLAQRRNALESKRKELLAAIVNRDSLQVENFPDVFDQLTSTANRELAIGLAGRNTRLLHDVEEALRRIECGDYGHCAECGKPIPLRRLDAVPWALCCIPCQQRQEANGTEAEGALLEAA